MWVPDNVDQNYPDYPAFSPLPAASIGEVGNDTQHFAVKDPYGTYDLMSYCDPKWISAYNYVKGFQSLPPLPPSPPQGPAHFDRDGFVAVGRCSSPIAGRWSTSPGSLDRGRRGRRRSRTISSSSSAAAMTPCCSVQRP